MLARPALVVKIIALFAILTILPAIAFAHNVSKRDATFVQANKGSASTLR